MKIIASDFDGTIRKWGGVSLSDRAAIRRWQAQGNAFGIVTGRGREIFDLARDEGIALDYAVVLNGAQVIGRSREILYEEVFDRALEGPYMEFVSRYPQTDPATVQYALRDPEKAETEENIYGICQFSLVLPTDADADALTERLNEAFADTLVSFANGRCINTVKKGVSKATGIACYASRFGIAEKDVFAVGDAKNDLPMLLAYDGFCVNSASEEMKQIILRHVENITELCDIANRVCDYRYLYDNLRMRRPLRFREDGTFRILTYSDLHAHTVFSQETVDAIRTMVEYTKPDFVFINGDIIHEMDDLATDDPEIIRDGVRCALEQVMTVLEEKKIPWAHVFGNHDSGCGVADRDVMDLYLAKKPEKN